MCFWQEVIVGSFEQTLDSLFGGCCSCNHPALAGDWALDLVDPVPTLISVFLLSQFKRQYSV